MASRRRKRIIRVGGLVVIGLTLASLVSCVRVSNGTWYVQSAATPEGWPDMTPVGTVEVKQYPATRAAVTAGDSTQPMFMSLFRHIQRNDVAMTAPVEMTYADTAADEQPASMAFLYRSRTIGEIGSDGVVMVQDQQPQTFASVGVRGDYTREHYDRGLETLRSWLADHPGWLPVGPPRYLGYNGPFVPRFARYGEVQIPVIGDELTDNGERP